LSKVFYKPKVIRAEQIHYDEAAKRYRESDETIDNQEQFDILRNESLLLNPENIVLDLGCGTGRYFHCLPGVQRLIGVDCSGSMLLEAKNPYMQEEIKAMKIDLVRADINKLPFKKDIFNFAYSIGVLGEHAIFDSHIANEVYRVARVGAKFLFTTKPVPKRTFIQKIKHSLGNILRLLLAYSLSKKLGLKIFFGAFYADASKIENTLKRAGFKTQYIKEILKDIHLHNLTLAEK